MQSSDRFDTREFKAYKRKMERMAADALPRAIAGALTQAAVSATTRSKRNVRETMTLRNQYTERSVRYYKASPKKQIRQINSVTGSVSPYMGLQDSGGYRLPKRGRAAPVATLSARGGNRTAVVRKRYRAGTLGPGQFIGQPQGGRPVGVYERFQKNRRLRMIRNLSEEKVVVHPTHWHRDAVQRYGRRDYIEAAFVREAKRIINPK
jgi:hypothetical protein